MNDKYISTGYEVQHSDDGQKWRRLLGPGYAETPEGRAQAEKDMRRIESRFVRLVRVERHVEILHVQEQASVVAFQNLLARAKEALRDLKGVSVNEAFSIDLPSLEHSPSRAHVFSSLKGAAAAKVFYAAQKRLTAAGIKFVRGDNELILKS